MARSLLSRGITVATPLCVEHFFQEEFWIRTCGRRELVAKVVVVSSFHVSSATKSCEFSCLSGRVRSISRLSVVGRNFNENRYFDREGEGFLN